PGRCLSVRNIMRVVASQASHLRLLKTPGPGKLVRRMRCLEAEVVEVFRALKVSLVISQRLTRAKRIEIAAIVTDRVGCMTGARLQVAFHAHLKLSVTAQIA